MKTSLLKKLCAVIIASVFLFITADAQIIYKDVNPDTTVACLQSGCTSYFYLDLNNDGINDFSLTSQSSSKKHKGCVGFGCAFSDKTVSEKITPLNGNAVLVNNLGYPSYTSANNNIGSPATWGSNPNMILDSVFDYHNAIYYGNWLDTSDGYIGLKLITNGHTYYGWLRLSVNKHLFSSSSGSASFTIKDYAYNSVPDQAILAGQSTVNYAAVSAITATPYCAGNNVSVTYITHGTFNISNIFTAQLSDSSGSFANPKAIGSKQSSTRGQINAVIPTSVPTGTKYRIRVVSSSPSLPSLDNGTDIIISALSNPIIIASGPTMFCTYNPLDGTTGTVTLSTTPIPGYAYRWLLNGTSIADSTQHTKTVYTSGNYQCTVTNACGITTSNTIVVTANTSPVANIAASGPAAICKGGSVKLSANIDNGLTYQWQNDQGIIPGATSSSFIAQTTQQYWVAETDKNGCYNYSNLIQVEVTDTIKAVTVSTGSGNTTFCAAGDIELVADITNYDPNDYSYQYQWSKNGINISGATSNYYFPNTGGTYKCAVTNACGVSVISNGLKIKKQCSALIADAATDDEKIISTATQLKVAPNPFSNTTTISFTIPQSQKVSISIFDMTGRLVKILANEEMQQGNHEIKWNGNDEKGNRVPTGIYFLRINAGSDLETKKLSIIK